MHHRLRRSRRNQFCVPKWLGGRLSPSDITGIAVAVAISMVIGLAVPTPGQAQTLGKQAVPRPGAEAVSTTTHPRSVWVVHCAGCHGMDGSGSVVGRVPDMRSVGQFLRLDGGREFLISVPGVMGSGLTDQQVAEVTNWVLATLAAASVPQDHRPYQADDVRAARLHPLTDVATTRHQLLAQARERGVPIH